jgi:short-subunit dehydrogenase
MARWMVEKGAKNIVLVSRSGSATGKVKELITELATAGANIQVRSCDVANSASVEILLTKELADMPPVRGIVHGAMVLKVSPTSTNPHSISLKNIRTSSSKRWPMTNIPPL